MKPALLGNHAPRGVILALQLIVLALLSGLFVTVYSQKDNHLSLARIKLQSQATILGDRLAATLGGIDLVLLNAQNTAAQLLTAHAAAPSETIRRLHLPNSALLHPGVADIFLFDAQGTLVARHSGDRYSKPPDVTGLLKRHRDQWHDFFLELQAEDSAAAAEHKPGILISRRMLDASGAFAGVLTASVYPAALYDPYQESSFFDIDTVLLLNHDMQIIACWPARADLRSGTALEETAVFAGTEDELSGGGLREAQTAADLIAAYQLPHLPLHIAALRDKKRVLGPWHKSLMRTMLAALALLTLTAALAYTGMRQHHKRRNAEDALQQSEQLYRSLAENYPNGVLLLFDGQGIIRKADGRQMESMGLNKQHAEGRRPHEILPPAAGRNLAAHHAVALRGRPVHFTLVIRGRIYMGHSLPFSCETHVSGGMTVLEDITELQQTQARLRESQTMLSEAQRLARIGHFDMQFMTQRTYCSPELLQMAGLPRDFDVSKAHGLLEHLAPAVPPIFRAMLQSPLHESISYKEAGIPYRAINGSAGFGMLRVKLIRDASGSPLRLSGTFQDITEEHNTRLALLQSEARYRALSANLPNAAVCLFDSELRLLIADGQRADMLGMSGDTPAGTRLSAVMPQALTVVLEPLCRQAVAGRRSQMEMVHAERVHEVTAIPVPAHLGGYDGLLVILDITKRKATEAALKDALETAEHAVRLKSQFVANISHELRTPLSGILGITDVMLGRPQPEETRSHLGMIRSVAEALRLVVNDILDFSRLEAGKMPLHVRTFSLPDTVEQVLAPLRLAAAQKGLALTLRLDSALPEAVRGDAGRLSQILTNLAANAVKFTTKGFVRVDVYPDKNDVICFDVCDTGPGIPHSKRHLLFESFVQLDGSLSRQHQGSGLGLAISRGLALLMGGTLQLAEAGQTGSLFRLALPLPAAQEAAASGITPALPAAEAPVTTKKPAAAAATGAHILLVEDNTLNQEFISLFLQEGGYTVTAADNGTGALENLEKRSFDAVLMDVQMPGMNGLETTKRIRNSGRAWARIPVIALTANNMAGDREYYLASGMNGYVEKPVNKAQLFGEIERCLTEAHADTAP
jgi:hypothetical protein